MTVEEKLTKIAEDMPKVYEAGVEQGKQAEWSAFWDEYQQKGKRTHYAHAFAGHGWTKNNFKPKYDIRPTNARLMFNYSTVLNFDMVELSEQLGIVFDFSNCTSFYQCFTGDFFKRLGVIDTTSAKSLDNAFSDFRGDTIDKLIIKEDGTTSYSNGFYLAYNLINLTLEGVIGTSGFTFKDCTKLNKASIESIVNALSTTTTGLTVTFSKTAVNKAFATTTGGSNGSTSAEWLALVATRSNWTIALA